MRSDRGRLLHILDAIESIKRNVSAGRETLDNEALAAAAVRWLEVIGEAATHVSPEFKAQHPDISWRGPIEMRNRLVRGYFDVQVDRVWEAINRDVPALERQIRDVLEDPSE